MTTIAPLLRVPLLVVVIVFLLLPVSTEGFSNEAALRKPTLLSKQPKQRQHQHEHQASVALPEHEYLLPNTCNDEDSDSDQKPLVLVQVEKLRTTVTRLWDRRGGSSSTPSSTDSFLKRHPFVSAVAITTTNAVVADLLTQLVFQASSSSSVSSVIWNWKRTLVFGLFGFFYQGMVQYAIVNGVWEKVFPGTSRRAVMSKICAMNLLSDPLFFMPTFYIFQQLMMTSSTTATTFTSTVKAALMAYKANCLLDWRNSWMVWFPGHAVTYGVMPSHKRIPWMAFLSFFYMCILSITRG